jgi:hypothetical protein
MTTIKMAFLSQNREILTKMIRAFLIPMKNLFFQQRDLRLCLFSISPMPDLFQTVFTVRKTFLERLADYFEAEEEPEESVQVFYLIRDSSNPPTVHYFFVATVQGTLTEVEYLILSKIHKICNIESC